MVVPIHIMLQITKAIEYVHDCHIVHGNLKTAKLFVKPNNFLGREKFQVKVSSFGHTKLMVEPWRKQGVSKVQVTFVGRHQR